MKTEYLYNAEGLRIQKITTETTASGTTTTTTDYILHGKNIVHLTQGDDELHFFYDASNKPAIVEFNETRYGYVQNLQGDICQIIDANGAVVVEYTYDAWGKVLNVTGSMAGTLGKIQPFRYRGYVYDVETGLYYLRSRYYIPDIGRFASADSYSGKIVDLGEHNLFSYCDSNPIVQIDNNGQEKTYVFYYYFEKSSSPLHQEAYNSPYYDAFDSNQVVMQAVKTSQDFIDAWNQMVENNDAGDIYLYLHGDVGVLQLAYDSIGVGQDADYSFSDLNKTFIKRAVFDFSCYGAAKNEDGNSVALALNQLTSAPVYACDVGVSYRHFYEVGPITPSWRARTQTKHGTENHWHVVYHSLKQRRQMDIKLQGADFFGKIHGGLP